ncbi:MAG: hypothetical protein ACJ77K_01340 [Bacteroidia bacterium]
MVKFWHYISNLGLNADDSKNFTRRVHLINRMCFLSTFTNFFFMFFMLFYLQSTYYAGRQLFAGILCCAYLVLCSKRLYRAALYWIFFNILLNVLYVSLEEKGAGVEYFLIPLGLLPFVMEEKLLNCYLMISVSFLTFCAGYFLRDMYVPHELIPVFKIKVSYLVCVGAVFALCFFILLQFKTVYRVYEGIIEQQRDEVEEKNKEIMDSIRYAKRIQQSLLPTEKYIDKNIKRMKNSDQ